MDGEPHVVDLAGLDAVLPLLRCPVCSRPLDRDAGRVGCSAGHGFGLARQGYLNLAVGRRAGTADSAGMVEAREAFLARGHYRPIADAISAALPHARTVVDLAGGTGYYLAQVLDATGARGLCLDISVPALRRAARAHPRAAAIGADAWLPLPLAEDAADVVLSVFGPRDPAEIERVLCPDGVLVVASPGPEHLVELIGPLSMLAVDPRKSERAGTAFARFAQVATRALRYPARFTRDDAYAAAAMGPTARHVPEAELRSRTGGLPEDLDVTVDVVVTLYRRRHPSLP